MSGFDLSDSIEAESGNNSETTTETDDEVTRFEANEVAEGYILSGEWARCLEETTVGIFDFERPSVSWGDDLSDYQTKVENNDYNDQQKLQLLAMLFKGTFGEKQSSLNSGYGPGWDKDQNPPKPYDNENTHYADEFRHLPAFEWESLDGGERENFEVEDIDPSELGFDRTHGGPKLPVIDGERVPIIVEDGDELEKALRMVNSIDFDNLTFCEENGSLQNTPTLGPSEDGEAESKDEDDEDNEDDGFSFAENPEAVAEANANQVKVGGIESKRTLETMLRVEKDTEDRDSVVNKLETRIGVVSDNDEDNEDDEENEEMSLEQIQKVFDFSELEMDAVKHRVNAEKAESHEEAAKQISEV